jgi:hypothetical protein
MIAGHVPLGRRHFLHLPFEMPPGVGRLEVRYDYSDPIDSDPHITGGNTVDLGLFDQRGSGLWRQDSGVGPAARAAKVLCDARRGDSGHLPGPLEPGKWHIFLGLYKLSPGLPLPG